MSKRNKHTAQAISFLLFSCVLAFEGAISVRTLFFAPEKVVVEPVMEKLVTQDPFDAVSVVAESAVVMDITTGEFLFSKDPKTIRPIASITKVMSALVSSEQLSDNSEVQIAQSALAQDEDNGLLLNEKWSFRKLLDFSLLVSSNDGAYAIANVVGSLDRNRLNKDVIADATSSVNIFVQKMNQKAQIIGLNDTNFNNPSGLDVDTVVSGGYSTATDVAKMFAYVVKNNRHIVEATTLQNDEFVSEDGISHLAQNTNSAYPNIPSLLASKTGYTDLAGGNLAIVYDVGVNHPIAIVVLDSTFRERFTDIEALVSATDKYFSR